MSRLRFPASAVLVLAIFFWAMVPIAQAHGGGHGGGGHGGHAGFGYGGYGGYHGFHHGFGHGYGYRGFGFGGFGYPGFGSYGYPGFGFGGWGYGLYGLGGFGYGGLGYGGYGYGGFGFRGFGYGGFGYGGYGGYGYGGFASGCNCCCLSAYPYPAGSAPVYSGGNAPAMDGSTPLPMPNSVSSRPRYMDYYARNANPTAPAAAVASASPRYVDYYARNSDSFTDNKARLHVALPAGAQLWLNGQLMHRTGAERDFITPQLPKGQTYAYQVKARWSQDGRPMEETLQVQVRANKTTTVRLGTSSLAKR